MQTKLLLPRKFKNIGWIIVALTLPLGIWILWSGYEFGWVNVKFYILFPSSLYKTISRSQLLTVNLTRTIVGVLFIIGSLMVGFSKEKIEDEYIASIRMNALVWAVFVNYSLLIVAFVFIYDLSFLHVMVYNMFTVLLLFIIRFHYLLLKNKVN